MFVGHTDQVTGLVRLSISLSKKKFMTRGKKKKKISRSIVLSNGRDRLVKMWDLWSGKCLQTIRGHNSFILKWKMHSENVLVTSCRDRFVRVFDLRAEKLIKKLDEHTCEVNAMRLTRESPFIVTGSADKVFPLFISCFFC